MINLAAAEHDSDTEDVQDPWTDADLASVLKQVLVIHNHVQVCEYHRQIVN